MRCLLVRLPRSCPVILAIACLLLSPASAERGSSTPRSSEHAALDAALPRLISYGLRYSSRKDARLLVELVGWGDYRSSRKRVVLGSLQPYLDRLTILRAQPGYLFEADNTYRRRALEQAYPGCSNFVIVERPAVLPDGGIRITYRINYWDYHLHSRAHLTLQRSKGKWRIVEEDRGVAPG